MKMINIKFKSPVFLKYLVIDGDENGWNYISRSFPLPWGEMEVEDALIEGNPWQSRGGAWYWKLPPYCIMGYGDYNPYMKFKFTGTIHVTSRYGFKGGHKYGWRQGYSKWVYLDGKIYPCDAYKAEHRMRKLVDYYSLYPHAKWHRFEFSQGHLEGKNYINLSSLIQKDRQFKSIMDTPFSRWKIFNHQSFGDCRIWYIGDETWVVYAASEDVKLVSPDHLDKPVEIPQGISIITHPFPSDDVD
jgi:hypothetical protein